MQRNIMMCNQCNADLNNTDIVIFNGATWCTDCGPSSIGLVVPPARVDTVRTGPYARLNVPPPPPTMRNPSVTTASAVGPLIAWSFVMLVVGFWIGFEVFSG